jgi:hypothetical protein
MSSCGSGGTPSVTWRSGAWGNILINPADGTFIVLATGLDAVAKGGYLLWIETADGLVPLTFFYVDQFGSGIGHGKLSHDVGDAELSVSHEYDSSVRAPTTPANLQRFIDGPR